MLLIKKACVVCQQLSCSWIWTLRLPGKQQLEKQKNLFSWGRGKGAGLNTPQVSSDFSLVAYAVFIKSFSSYQSIIMFKAPTSERRQRPTHASSKSRMRWVWKHALSQARF
jgi:hypothetical protein